MISRLRCITLVFLVLTTTTGIAAAEQPPPAVKIQVSGPAVTVFNPGRDGCDGSDVPDAPLRAMRTETGVLRMFGLHYTNHFLEGATLGSAKIVCRSALRSGENPDPAAYDDRSWIAATWTNDGRQVDALVHHEYQANAHPGRCRFPDYMACWFNTLLAVRSTTGGASFDPATPRVVASAPFRQDVDQGRHRGFFNPSNLFSDGRFVYFLASTTGWNGQEGGVCLFRSATPDAPGSWRAYDGRAFTVGFPDPYRSSSEPSPRSCRTLPPFPAPVGSVVRQRGSGIWFAVFQAAKNAPLFPLSGFYATGSRDLLHWSEPRLILAGGTNYEDPCRSGGQLIAYPSLLDPDATGRNFDDVGGSALLFYVVMRTDGCTITGDRTLVSQSVRLSVTP